MTAVAPAISTSLPLVLLTNFMVPVGVSPLPTPVTVVVSVALRLPASSEMSALTVTAGVTLLTIMTTILVVFVMAS